MTFKFFILWFSSVAWANVSVVTTTTDIAWAARQIGGEHVSVSSLLKGSENPHYVDTIPAFIRQVADADVVCIVGLDLEVGWMPKIFTRSGNAKVQPGGKGYCELGRKVQPLEVPTTPVNRSMGDVHPFGNPHFWLGPKVFADASEEIMNTLSAVDPTNAAAYRKNYEKLKSDLVALQETNLKKLSPALAKFTQPPLIEYHREFSYLFNAYKILSAGSIEEKPGIPPSAGRIADVATHSKKSGVKLALAGPYAPKRVLDRFTELSGIKVQTTPTSVSPDQSYIDFQKSLVDTLVKALSS